LCMAEWTPRRGRRHYWEEEEEDLQTMQMNIFDEFKLVI